MPFDSAEPCVRYHRAHYSTSTLSIEQKNRLARFAFEDDRAYRVLKQRGANSEENIEPAWMHRQAEHFAACLLVPREPLFGVLKDGGDPAFYGTHVRLAEMFQVSKRVIQIRLKKLDLIEEPEPGKFFNKCKGRRFSFR